MWEVMQRQKRKKPYYLVPGHQAGIRCSMERRVVGQVMDMWCEGENVAHGAASLQKDSELCGCGGPKDRVEYK